MAAKFRIACHLITWAGEQKENLEKCLGAVADAGYEGVEGVAAEDLEDLLAKAKLAAKYGLHLVNVSGPTPEARIDYNLLLGNDAAEVPACRRQKFGGPDPSDDDFEAAARSLDEICAHAKEHNIKPFHHAHRGTMIETPADADRLLSRAPDLWLLFDTGHMLCCGGDPIDALKNWGHRIGHVHLKDFTADDPATWDNRTSKWMEEGRFEELGKGSFGFDVGAALKGLEEVGYDGWVSIEQDRATHHSPPATAKVNREYLKSLGY